MTPGDKEWKVAFDEPPQFQARSEYLITKNHSLAFFPGQVIIAPRPETIKV